MKKKHQASVRFFLLVTALLGAAAEAGAQCPNTGGGPPVDAPMLAVKTSVHRGLGGLWGDGNDGYKVLKGTFTAAGTIDPVTTHDVHLTIRKNGIGGPVVFSTMLPAGSFWTPAGSGFSYFDPGDTYGVRRFIFKSFGGPGSYLITRIIGRNVSLANAPLVSPTPCTARSSSEPGGRASASATASRRSRTWRRRSTSSRSEVAHTLRDPPRDHQAHHGDRGHDGVGRGDARGKRESSSCHRIEERPADAGAERGAEHARELQRGRGLALAPGRRSLEDRESRRGDRKSG